MYPFASGTLDRVERTSHVNHRNVVDRTTEESFVILSSLRISRDISVYELNITRSIAVPVDGVLYL